MGHIEHRHLGCCAATERVCLQSVVADSGTQPYLGCRALAERPALEVRHGASPAEQHLQSSKSTL